MNTYNLNEVALKAREYARSDRQREEAKERREQLLKAFNENDKNLAFGLVWTIAAVFGITLVLFLVSVGIIY